MPDAQTEDLKAQIRRARGKFLSMAAAYSLGAFNDNFFKQAALLLAVDAGMKSMQGYATVIFALPFLLFAAPAGWLADRFVKKHIVVGAKALEFLAMIAGALGVYYLNWPLILTMVGLMGLQSTIFSPALNGSIPELYPESFVTRANGNLKVAVTVAILMGIALAGGALDAGGGSAAGRLIVAVAVLSIASVGVLMSLGAPRFAAKSPDARFPWSGPVETLKDFRDIAGDGLLMTTVVAGGFFYLIAQFQVLVINDLGLNQLGLSKTQTSWLMAAQLIGVAAGGVLAGFISKGERWHKVLVPGALGMSGGMLLIGASARLSQGLAVATCSALLLTIGVFGGLFLIPVESFIQVRPSADRKGRVIACGNFAAFTGILVSGPLFNAVSQWWRPTTCFVATGLGVLAMGVWLAVVLPSADNRGPNFVNRVLAMLVRAMLWLRYRVRVAGVDAVAAKGRGGILFLPNHPALVDPLILFSHLYPDFAPRPLADRDQVELPVLRTLTDRLRVLTIPDIMLYGGKGREQIEEALSEIIESLQEGDNVLLYPAGHILRHRFEDLGANSAVEVILDKAPNARVVLIRTRGLWGSSFGHGQGKAPKIGLVLRRGVLRLFANFLLFSPRRPVSVTLTEPEDLPRDADRVELNRYLEAFYNEDADHNTYVPYTIWERGGIRQVPEPERKTIEGSLDDVPETVRELVLTQLREMTDQEEIGPDLRLANDLGLDSLARTDLILWIESEFGFPVNDPETLRTVGDVLLAACGMGVGAGLAELKPVPRAWFSDGGTDSRLTLGQGETLTDAFLTQAKHAASRIIVADQISGARTYRDLITAIMVLKPEIEAYEGERVGIMLPAGVAATVSYLSTLFAGKTPVMLNWTVGSRNLTHALEVAEIKKVLTAKPLVARVENQGTDLGEIKESLVYLEELGKRISLSRKIGAWLRSRVSWTALGNVRVPETAVVLFTSGSESLPKAVPLTHANLLTNIRDALDVVPLMRNDRLLGMLPPFHSFGLTGTLLAPVCAGLPVAYHANPTDGAKLAQLVEAYKTSVVFGTPTFIAGIFRAAEDEQLQTLRIAFSGAEKCPDSLYEEVQRRSSHMTILEGYGITECSPIVSCNAPEDAMPFTIGRPLPSVEHMIVHPETGERIELGAQGMLLVRGPSIFPGYLKYDGESPFIELDGKQWYRTGDLVKEDDRGFLTFCGRLKRFVKLGGEMISLPAIEAILDRHYHEEGEPCIAVEATPSEDHPEIVLFTTNDVGRAEVNGHIRDAGLSPIHNVRRVIKLDEIPLLGTGKTDYRALKEELRNA